MNEMRLEVKFTETMPQERGLAEGAAAVRLGLIIEGFYLSTDEPNRIWTISAVDMEGRTVAASATGRMPAPNFIGAPAKSGFRIDLPPTLLNGGRHHLRLLADGENSILGDIEIDGTRGGRGTVDEIEPTFARGWAMSYLEPNTPVLVEARLDGRVIGADRASSFRADVADAFRSPGFAGFEFALSPALSADEITRVTFRLADCGSLLHISKEVRAKGAAAAMAVAAKAEGEKLVIGNVDRFDDSGVSGWALDTRAPSTPVLVSLFINGQKIGSVLSDGRRDDVKRAHKSSGFHGFHIAIPPGMDITQPLSASVLVAGEVDALRGSPKVLQPARKGLKHPESSRGRARYERHLHKRSGIPQATTVAIAIVNLNGAPHLRMFFETFSAYNSYKNYTIYIADHGSTDESLAVCKEWSEKLNIVFYPRGKNYSFSESNNFISENSTEGLILFINNDIAFAQDVLWAMSWHLEDPEVGVVGLKLVSMQNGEGHEPAQNIAPFVQHLGIKFDFSPDRLPISCYELPVNSSTVVIEHTSCEVPAVTGAALMIRREDFVAIGGFDETYFYGYEDVDLCLTTRRLLEKKVICANDVFAYHARGATRTAENRLKRARFAQNFDYLRKRHGSAMRQAVRSTAYHGDVLYRGKPLRVAFAVSKTDMGAAEADFFTAYELGEFLVELYGWEVSYLQPENWYDLGEYDLVVAMRHDFDPRKIERANWNLSVVAWPRNWFNHWLNSAFIGAFDAIWTASKPSVEKFQAVTFAPVNFLPIATNPRRFRDTTASSSDCETDYCFTGSFFGAPRDIISNIQPDALPYRFGLFGHGWDRISWLKPYWRGALPYAEMPKIYASTKIVVDDANHTVKGWGSVNSRVFDALAAGRLVIMNDAVGNEQVLGELLPVATDAASLKEQLQRYLTDDEARIALVEKARAHVLSAHTYRHRAQSVFEFTAKLMMRRRIGVRDVPAMKGPSTFADFLARQLQRANQQVRLKAHNPRNADIEWGGCDVLLYLTTAATVTPALSPDQTHIRIHLGSSANLTVSEVDKFDLVIVLCGEVPGASTSIIALFGKDDEAPELTFSEDGEIVSSDLSSLMHALEAFVPTFLVRLDEIDADKHQPRRAIRHSSAHVVAEIASTDLLFWPDYSATNPYQRILYQNLSHDIRAMPGTIEAALALQSQSSGVPVFFHLHWTSPIIGLANAAIVAAGRVDRFLSALDAFLTSGGRFIWTIHNVMPHEAPFPEVERRLCQALAERAHFIHVHSPLVTALARGVYDLPEQKVVVGEHGSYVSVYPSERTREDARRQFGFEDDDIVLIFFGQIRAYKGIEDLLEAFAKSVASEGPSLKLLIAGASVNMSLDAIKTSVAETPGVTLIAGEVPDQEIQSYLRAADFLVLPYRKVLTSGSVYLGLSFDLPVIAPQSGLLSEVVTPECGRLFDPTDRDGLLKAIGWARSLTPTARDILRKNAGTRAQSLGWDKIGSALSSAIHASAKGSWQAIKVGKTTRRCVVREPSGPQAKPARVASIVLHYKNLDDTVRCVFSLLNQSYPSQEIYIISNDESADAFAALARQFPQCVVIQSPENLGYAGGNNIALALARSRAAELFWIVNPDTVAGRDYLGKMVRLADARPESSLFGSTIVFGDRPTTVWFSGGKIDFGSGLETSHINIGRPVTELGNTPINCDYVTGASLLGRMSVIDIIGYIPEDYFLYFEETDWCFSAKNSGLTITVDPNITIEHHKRSEQGGAPTLVFIYYYCRNALLMCARFAPEQVKKTEVHVREKLSTWLRRIVETRPEEGELARAVAERAFTDGRALRSGKVDFLEGLDCRSTAKKQSTRAKRSRSTAINGVMDGQDRLRT